MTFLFRMMLNALKQSKIKNSHNGKGVIVPQCSPFALCESYQAILYDIRIITHGIRHVKLLFYKTSNFLTVDGRVWLE